MPFSVGNGTCNESCCFLLCLMLHLYKYMVETFLKYMFVVVFKSQVPLEIIGSYVGLGATDGSP